MAIVFTKQMRFFNEFTDFIEKSKQKQEAKLAVKAYLEIVYLP